MWMHASLFDMGWTLVVIPKLYLGCDPVSMTSSDLSSFLCAVWTPLERRTMAGQDLDQLSHEFRFVFERLVVRQLEGVLDPICTQRLTVIFRFGGTSLLRLGFEIFPLFSVCPGFFNAAHVEVTCPVSW